MAHPDNGTDEITVPDTSDELNHYEAAYLDFLEQDVLNHPERLKPFTTGMLAKARTLIGDFENVDLNEPLPEGDD